VRLTLEVGGEPATPGGPAQPLLEGSQGRTQLSLGPLHRAQGVAGGHQRLGIGCRSALGQHLGEAGLGLLHPTAMPVGGHLQPPGPEARTSLPLGQVGQGHSGEFGLALAVAPDPCDLGTQQRDRRPDVGHHPALGGHLELPELGPHLEGSFDLLEQSFHAVQPIAVPFEHRQRQAQPGA
jgi:hypothetical protein